MLCSYDDLCYIICTVLRGRYCVIQHSCCNINKNIIVSTSKEPVSKTRSGIFVLVNGVMLVLVLCSAADLDGSLMAPAVDKSLSVSDRLVAVKSVLEAMGQQCTATVFDAKEQYKTLCRCCGIVLRSRCVDPKVACWLLDPSSSDKNLHCLVTNYCPLEASLLQGRFSCYVDDRRQLCRRVSFLTSFRNDLCRNFDMHWCVIPRVGSGA